MRSQPKILGLIPARAGSEGVPGKHLKLLGGKPLIGFTIESALKSRFLDKIALSTDCPEIIEFASKYAKIVIPFVRPIHLAKTDVPTVPVIQHAINHYENLGQKFDYVCLLQATTPFRSEGLIDNAIKFMLNSDAQSLVTVRTIPSKFHPSWSFEMSANNKLFKVMAASELIPRRQDLSQTFYRDGQIYIASTEMIEGGLLVNNETIGFLNESGSDVNIDTLADWNQAEMWLNDGK